MTKIEQVARAIASKDTGGYEGNKDYYMEMAKAAIAAMREPTTMMSISGDEVLSTATESRSPNADDVFRDMIDAALAEDGK